MGYKLVTVKNLETSSGVKGKARTTGGRKWKSVGEEENTKGHPSQHPLIGWGAGAAQPLQSDRPSLVTPIAWDSDPDKSAPLSFPTPSWAETLKGEGEGERGLMKLV